jgi:hypothetical protein
MYSKMSFGMAGKFRNNIKMFVTVEMAKLNLQNYFKTIQKEKYIFFGDSTKKSRRN